MQSGRADLVVLREWTHMQGGCRRRSVRMRAAGSGLTKHERGVKLLIMSPIALVGYYYIATEYNNII